MPPLESLENADGPLGRTGKGVSILRLETKTDSAGLGESCQRLLDKRRKCAPAQMDQTERESELTDPSSIRAFRSSYVTRIRILHELVKPSSSFFTQTTPSIQ